MVNTVRWVAWEADLEMGNGVQGAPWEACSGSAPLGEEKEPGLHRGSWDVLSPKRDLGWLGWQLWGCGRQMGSKGVKPWRVAHWLITAYECSQEGSETLGQSALSSWSHSPNEHRSLLYSQGGWGDGASSWGASWVAGPSSPCLSEQVPGHREGKANANQHTKRDSASFTTNKRKLKTTMSTICHVRETKIKWFPGSC